MSSRHKLSPAFVKNAPAGKHGDGGGLWLYARKDGGSQWVLRVTVHGRRREMGLGGYPAVSLKQARETAEHWRAVSAAGQDPVKVREKEARERAKADNTLRKIAEEAFEARKAELKGDGKAGRWFSPLELHVLPKLGRVPIEEIDARDIRDTLGPPVAHQGGHGAEGAQPSGPCSEARRGNGVGRRSAGDREGEGAAGKVPPQAAKRPCRCHGWTCRAFYASLDERTVTHLALRLLILTGVRSAPLRFLRLEQIDGEVWTIPGESMKGRKDATEDFRVPLSGEALTVIEQAKAFERDGWLFPSIRKGVISDATMSRFMERRGMAARPHGFRSSLRTWLAEATDAPHEVAETVLAHQTGSSVVRSYRRTDFLEQRRALMERWAAHCVGGGGTLVRLANA